MKRVGSPKPSPDGKWVVCTVYEPSYDARDIAVDLWLLPADGSAAPRRLTTAKGSESGSDWSPDGRRIAFSAKREGDEAAQLYVLDVAGGGEAERVTSLSTGARSPQWSPDGKRLLFASEVYPKTKDDAENRRRAKELKERKTSARVYEGFPIRYWDKWLDERTAHLFVQEARPGAKARDLLAGSKLADEPGFGGRETDSGEDLDATWTPDGSAVVFAATTVRNRAAYARVYTQLYRVSAAGGEEPKRLTNDELSYSNPVFSPDGRHLVCGRSGDAGQVYSLTRLVRHDWPWKGEGKPVVLTAKADVSAGRAAFSTAGDRVYFSAEQEARERLFSVAVAGGEVRREADMPRGNLGSPQAAPSGAAGGGDRIVTTWDSTSNPPEIYALVPNEGTWRALTRFNADRLAALDLPAPEAFWFTNKEGRKIHSWLVRPSNFNPKKKYPVVALIHGGPASAWRDAWATRWNTAVLAAPGYVLVLTNYTGSTGFGEAFAQAIKGDPLRGPGAEVDQAVTEAQARFPFLDGSRLAAGGASYGGHLANWLQGTTTRYRCLISHAGLINLESQWGTSDSIYHREVGAGGPPWEQGIVWREQNPIRLAAQFRTPMLITAGELDYRVPYNQALESWSVHQRQRVPSKLIVFPDENHWISRGENSRFWYGEVHAWLARWLK